MAGYCRKHNIPLARTKTRLNLGWDIEDAFNLPKTTRAVHFMPDGGSIKLYCRENNLNYIRVINRVRRGWDIEDAINQPNNTVLAVRRIMIEGRPLKAVCVDVGIKYARAYKRLASRGRLLSDDLTVVDIMPQPKKTNKGNW